MSLQQFLRILRARWLLMLITVVIAIAAAVAISLILPARYTATATVVVDFKSVDPVSGGILPMMPLSGYLATQVDILRSHSIARRAVDELRLAENPMAQELYMQQTEGRGTIRDFLAQLLLRELEVQPSRESSVINVSYTGNDPRFSAVVANAFVKSYIETTLELKVAPAQQTNVFFNEQIKSLRDNLEKAQVRLSAYQREKGIIATDERLDVESNRLNDLSSQLVAAQAQTYDSLSRRGQVQAFVARGQVPDTLPDVLANPVIQNLKSNLTQLELKRLDLSTRAGKNHPSYQAIASEMDEVKQKLLQEMKIIGAALGNTASIAQEREDQIKTALSAQRQKVLAMKQVRDDQAVLLREVESAQRAYDGAMSRMTQTKLESQTTQTNVAVINEAIEPINPSFPNLTLNIAVAIVLGSIIAIGAALLREFSDRIVRSEADLVETLGVPVLGVLSREKRRHRALPGSTTTPQAAH
jgi:polysaccharide biosynthesis transport protein